MEIIFSKISHIYQSKIKTIEKKNNINIKKLFNFIYMYIINQKKIMEKTKWPPLNFKNGKYTLSTQLGADLGSIIRNAQVFRHIILF